MQRNPVYAQNFSATMSLKMPRMMTFKDSEVDELIGKILTLLNSMTVHEFIK
jgi:hypothetical protein